MKLFFSVSNKLAKFLRLDAPRLSGPDGQQPGVQPTVTHSTQISWQLDLIVLDDEWLVVAVEAYSRYTLVIPYVLRPDWHEVEADFKEQWLQHLLSWMHMAGVVDEEWQARQVATGVAALEETVCYRNRDMSIGGHLSDIQLWLRTYLEERRPKRFKQRQVWEFCDYINQLSRRVGGQRRQQGMFLPAERFLTDGLYRFASGLNLASSADGGPANFPNPHRLRGVKQ
ncbi:DUF6933 domain-containing protein [Musicola paradisiaca]|uniref:Amino acid adenylation n=1 Tax=Musicola paradisiaca (strain Ech703) TaxID=579405 RepID=C6C6M3_MUSP7|nr:hypothetical protein [Musicola paradisiaca]ACS83942.1 amino acid adenylation [Musicola paradisiaca Ech703]